MPPLHVELDRGFSKILNYPPQMDLENETFENTFLFLFLENKFQLNKTVDKNVTDLIDINTIGGGTEEIVCLIQVRGGAGGGTRKQLIFY